MERRKGMMREAKMGKEREKYKKNAQGIAHIKNYMYLCRRFERSGEGAPDSSPSETRVRPLSASGHPPTVSTGLYLAQK